MTEIQEVVGVMSDLGLVTLALMKTCASMLLKCKIPEQFLFHILGGGLSGI
jgi:hypothetical protein